MLDIIGFKVTYCNSSGVSNFLGFLGQHSHMYRFDEILGAPSCLPRPVLSLDILRAMAAADLPSDGVRWCCRNAAL